MRLVLSGCLLCAGLLSLGQAQTYEFDTQPITSCWNEGGIINFPDFLNTETAYFTEQCITPSGQDQSSNPFAAYGAAELQRINQVYAEKITPLWEDNTGGAYSLIQSGANILRTYEYCLNSVCELLARDCAQYNQNDDWRENFDRCNERKDRLMLIAQNQLAVQLEANLERKSRSLMVEKMSTINWRFYQWFYGRVSSFDLNISSAMNAILALARQVW